MNVILNRIKDKKNFIRDKRASKVKIGHSIKKIWWLETFLHLTAEAQNTCSKN